VVDRERVLAKLDDLDRYLAELRQVIPGTFEEYRALAVRRACERILQISIEAALDVCGLLVTGLRLGLPGDEEDLLEKLGAAGVLTQETLETLRRMRGLRNILVHEYGRVDDRVVYEILKQRLGDFEAFHREVVRTLPDRDSRGK
jgi:uncharacterized protein YutE (UPF0331/DUF86 family)